MSHTFHAAKSYFYLKWDNSLAPVLTVNSGSEVSFDLLDGGNNQFTASSTSFDVANFDFARGDPALGRVYIKGAEPGDVLKIEFLSLKTASYGWTAIFPGSAAFGLLADKFPEPALKICDLETHEDDGFAVFKDRIHIPIKPFLGVIKNRDSKAPFLLMIQVETLIVKGALFSCGDGHATQGDGEVCGTAIETPMKTTIRFTVEKGNSWVVSPHYVTSGRYEEHAVKVETKGAYAALGIDADLREASRKALRGLINWLVGEKGLTREES